KNDPAASEAFRKVLALDPENVLALRMLAEIAERGGRFDEAVEWLGRLVTVDAMNEDAADALARAKRRVAPAPAKPPAPVATAPVPSLHSPDRPAPAPAVPAPPAAPAFQARSDPAPPVRLLPERPASASSHGAVASAAPVP